MSRVRTMVRRAENEPSIPLRRAVDFALACAALPVVLLYGQWLLSWVMLGHMPRPSMDDPKFIDGASWMHPITFFGFVALIPTAITAVGAIAWYAAAGRPRTLDLAWRAAIVGAAFGLVFWDPFHVAVWWLD
jgi:hypothetical protein